MDELASRIVAANAQSFVVRAFSSYVRARVWFVAEWTLICWGVAISLGELAIVKLSVYELQKGCSLPRVVYELLLKQFAYSVRSGPLLLTGEDEAPVNGGVVEASEKRTSNFESKLR
jgi:hypothetical protein